MEVVFPVNDFYIGPVDGVTCVLKALRQSRVRSQACTDFQCSFRLVPSFFISVM